MDKKSKIFFFILSLLILGSVVISYYRYVVKRDYSIQAQAECDPYAEKCFVHVCDPDPDVDGDFCTGDPVEDTWYTKNISRMAYNIPNCDPKDESCTALVCEENEPGCSYEFCDETNVPEGDTCNDPVTYTLENPIEEEEGIEEDVTGAGVENIFSEEEGLQGGSNGENRGSGIDGIIDEDATVQAGTPNGE